jgi:hypothetical protein
VARFRFRLRFKYGTVFSDGAGSIKTLNAPIRCAPVAINATALCGRAGQCQQKARPHGPLATMPLGDQRRAGKGDPRTGAGIEVFYADRSLETFGRCGAGWFWWLRQRGCSPDGSPTGPFATGYAAYRHAWGPIWGPTVLPA